MNTLEQRVERLERSCRRWRLGFLILAVGGSLAAVAKPGPLPDAQFDHLSVQSLTIRSQPDGAFISAICDKDRASITLASPAASTLVSMVAQKDSTHLLLSRKTDKGLGSAAIGADGQSGFVNLGASDGKDREIEPE